MHEQKGLNLPKAFLKLFLIRKGRCGRVEELKNSKTNQKIGKEPFKNKFVVIILRTLLIEGGGEKGMNNDNR